MKIRVDRDIGDYADIIDLPHPDPVSRPRMRMDSRAAQFSPFAALTGYEALVEESARLTERALTPDDSQLDEIDRQLQLIADALAAGEQPIVRVTWFRPDARKDGGAFITSEGIVRRFDRVRGILCLAEDEIPLCGALSIEGLREDG